MFRRSRFSVRPNVGVAGRTTAAPQESPAAKQDGTPKEASEGISVPDESNAIPAEKTQASGDTVDQNGDGSSCSAALQRRKRFSIKPKVAPGRPSAPPRTPKSPIKAASVPHSETPPSEMEKPSTSSQAGTSAGLKRLLSPRTRRHSDNNKQHKPQPKQTPPPPDTPLVSVAEGSPEQTPPAADGSKKPESTSRSHLKEVPPRLPDKVPPSIPDKAAIEISEKARALVSSKTGDSLPSSALYLSRLLNSPLDVQRLVKAQKLRELLRHERSKEKNIRRAKARCKEFDLDPTKMTMRDLIHYLPTSNPMTSVLDDSAEENETEVPPSVERQETPERAQGPPAPPPPKVISSEEEGAAGEEEEQEEEIMVPQVKVAEDGSLIIDEESLTVEVQRTKGPNTIQDRDPIFERGSTTTYSSFRKGTYTKPWSIEETDMFYLAISMVGTDFSMICQLFTHRARSEIKNKFKREERENSWRIDKAFRERRKLDIEYFSKLLEKVLEVQRDRKKLKKLGESTSKKCKKRPKSKHSSKKLSDVEEEEGEEEESLMPELEGEKENEDQINGEAAAVKLGRKRKKKNPAEALNEGPSNKKSKTGEAGLPQDSEATLPEDPTTSDMAEKTENVTAKDAAIKPAKLCRSRAPKPLVPLGLKRSKKPLPSAKAKDTEEDKREETESVGADQEQERSENEAQLSQERKRKDGGDVSSEGEEEASVKPQRPTRYGRVPKPVQPLTYAAKDDFRSPTSPDTSKGPVNRGKSIKPSSVQKPKKPKLVTLRSSKSEFSDEENENEWEEEEHHLACSSSQDGDAHGFVQSSLHASSTEISEVDDTLVELDILDSMPDMLGISQDALCPDSTCQQARHDTGTSDPCEHQLDLLVDVIDFISSEQTEVSQDESYTEAAQTLLTIGNLAHISPSAQSGDTLEECAAETSAGVSEFTYPEEEILTADRVTSVESADLKVTSPCTEKLQSAELDKDNSLPIESSDQMQNVDHLGCKPGDKSSVIKAGPRSKVKPKPNLGRSSKTAKPISQTEISVEGGAEKNCSVAQRDSQDNETLVPAEETAPEISVSAAALFKDHTSFKHGCVDQVEAGAEDQNFPITQSQTVIESQSGPPAESEAGLNNPVEAVPEVEQSSSTDPSLQDRTRKPQLSGADDFTAGHAGESDVKSPFQPRGRLSKVKPKPVLQTSRMARSKRQTTEKIAEKESIEIQNSSAKTPAEPDKQTTSGETSPKALNQATPDQSAAEVLNFTKAVPELYVEQTNKDSETTLKETVSTGQKYPDLPALHRSHLDSEGNGDLSVADDAADEATSSRGEKKMGSCQTRKGRLQMVKPKPNLHQVSRGARSKAQNTEDAIQKNLELPENVSAEVEPQAKLCKKLSANEIKTNDGGNDSKVLTDQRTKEIPNPCEVEPEPCKEQTIRDEGATSDSAPENVSHFVGLESNLEPRESGKPPTAAEKLTSGQEEEPCASSQIKRGRLQKLKPKPNLVQTPRAARSKSSKDLKEKDSSSTLDPKVHVDGMPVVEATLPLDSQPETVPSPELQPVLTLDSTSPTTDSSSNEEEKKLPGPDSIYMNAEISDQKTTKNQNFSEVQLGTARVEGSPTTDKNLESHVEPTDSIVPELDLDLIQEQTSSVAGPPGAEQSPEVAPSCSSVRSRLSRIKPKPNLTNISRAAKLRPQISKESTQDSESCQKLDPENGSFWSSASVSEMYPEEAESNVQPKLQKIQPKPILPHTTRMAKIGPKEKDVSETQVDIEQDLMELTSDEKAAENQNICEVSNENQITRKMEETSSSFIGAPGDSLRNVASKEPEDRQEMSLVRQGLHVGEEDEAASTPLSKRRRFQKPKPNLPVTSKGTTFKPEPVQLAQSTEQPQISKSSDVSMTKVQAQSTSHKIKSPVSEPAVELSFSHEFVEESSSECKTNVEHLSNSEQNVPQRRPRLSRVRPRPNLALSTRASLRKVQTDEGSKSTSLASQQPQSGLKTSVEMEPSGDKMACEGPAERDVTDSSADVDAGTSSQVSSTSNASSVCAEGHSSAQSFSAPSEAADSSKTSNKAPQPPNLMCSSPPQTDADSDSRSKTGDAIQKAAVDPSPDSQWPVGRDTNKTSDKHSLSCLDSPPQEVLSTQNTSALNPEGIHTYPLLMEMMPEQVPSDPDEPFFVLSLTEIPVSSAGEAVMSEVEQLPHLPVVEDLMQKSWVSGESFTASGEKSLSDVPLCVSTTSAASEENPSESPETCVARETKAAAGKKAISTRRRTKPEATSSQKSQAAAAPEPQKQSDKKGKSLKKSDSSLGSKQNNRGSCLTRKAKEVSCETETWTSDPPAAAKSAAQASHDDAVPTKVCSSSVESQSRPTSDHRRGSSAPSSAPSSALRTSQESCAEISSAEAPTSVSQYFLSDIFTEVDES